MKKKNYKRWLVSLAAFAVLIALWELAVKRFGLFEYTLPPPSDVAKYIWNSTADGTLPSAIVVTLKRLLLGYAIGLCVGIPAGMLCSRFNVFQDTVGLLALGLQALPERVLGAACDYVVRTGRGSNAFRGRHGNCVVDDSCDGARGEKHSADLPQSRPHNGF